jgi:Rieske Fe-S protein
MTSKTSVGRRRFVKLCASTAAAVAACPDSLVGSVKHGEFYEKVQLHDHENNPIRASALVPDKAYLFFYPFISTPCFLIRLNQSVQRAVDLSTRDGNSYSWPGGVGPEQQIVSFSAICAHKMSHPSVQVSFINYRPEEVQFAGNDNRFQRRSNVIYCCSEGSVYDPADGARVLGGPAPQPLAAILLEHDPSTDALFAVGVAGQSMFDPYFRTFEHRLELEFKTENITERSQGSAQVIELASFCARQILC